MTRRLGLSLAILSAAIVLGACSRDRDDATGLEPERADEAAPPRSEPLGLEGERAPEVPDSAESPAPEQPVIDWAHVRECPAPPKDPHCSPQGKHCDCVAYLSLASAELHLDYDAASDDVRGCIGIMSHLPCPDDGEYRECARAARARSASVAQRRFFACAATVCDGRYATETE